MWGLCFVGLLAPRPRQHGMLHPKLRLTAQEKSNRKENAATHFQAQHLFSASKLHRHCAKRTVGVALPLPGRGGGISPHIAKSLRRVPKLSKQFFSVFCTFSMPARHPLGLSALRLRGGAGTA